jgi:cell division ATPase FtsA
VGYLTTTVAMMRGDGIMQMRSFDCGKGIFAAWLQDALEIPFASAEALFDKTDLSYEARESDEYTVDVVDPNGNHVDMSFSITKVQSYISEIIAAFAGDVQCVLHGFDEMLSVTAGMFLLGGGLSIRGAEECFSKKLNRKVRAAAPTMCPEYKKPVHAGMIGIAHYAFSQEEKKRNRFWK